MIQTIKVLIGIAILYGALLFTFYGGDFSAPNVNNLKESIDQSLHVSALDQNFRTQAIGAKNNSSVSSVSNALKPMVSKKFFVVLCDQNNRCVGTQPPNTGYVVANEIIEGNATNFNPTIVRLYASIR